MKPLRPLALSVSLLLCFSGVFAQGFGGSYLSFHEQISLPDAQHISLANSPLQVPLVAGNALRLIPPDMAKLDKRFIKSVTTDTLPALTGPDSCISTCLLDTLYLNSKLFLTQVEIEVAYFTDGTFKGKSSFGRGLLRELGSTRQNGRQIEISDVNPANLTKAARLAHIQNLDPNTQAAFPFQTGDLQEIRLIKGNTQGETEAIMSKMESLFDLQPVFCSFPSVDPNVPPQAALNRLQNRVTIRYFEPFHAQRAEALGEVMSFLFGIPMSDIEAEDMLPAYNGTPPARDYLEVWVQ